MKSYLTILFCILLILIANTASAVPAKGFKEGPYLLLGGGIMEANYDNNARLGTKIGDDFEPATTFIFGWDVLDYLGFELQGRYTNTKTDTEREHIVGLNLNCTYHLITNPLTDLKKWDILPFVKAGPGVEIAMVPGDPEGADRYLQVSGIGGNVSTGIHVLYKYFYSGLEFQTDFLHFSKKYQTINNVPEKVVSGGFEILYNLLFVVGVHY